MDLAAGGKNLPKKGVVRVVVDRLVAGRTERQRLVESIETVLGPGGKMGAHVLGAEGAPGEDHLWSDGLHCPYCDRTFRDPTPNLFSFNSPLGAGPECHGFGRTVGIDGSSSSRAAAHPPGRGAIQPLETPSAAETKAEMLAWAKKARVPLDLPWKDLAEAARTKFSGGTAPGAGWTASSATSRARRTRSTSASSCRGSAATRSARRAGGLASPRKAAPGASGAGRCPRSAGLSVEDARRWFDALDLGAAALGEHGRPSPAGALWAEIRGRLEVLDASGLAYLTLDRQARTLSGGEAQRVHLTTALGSHLVGALYVLDEPSVGLHPRDNARLVRILRRLRDEGNTVVVVEHDPAIVRAADHLIDMGPGAGERGGRLVAAGSPAEVARDPASLTGAYLAGRRRVPRPAAHRALEARPRVGVRGARENNLQGVDLLVPLGALTVLTGVSGSGKSTLAHDVLYLALRRALGTPEGTPGAHAEVVGADLLSDVVLVDQSAIGRTPRANAATYVGAWDGVRALFAKQPLSKERGYTASTFSFNVPGGRCERCSGDGHEKVEMQFLSDVYVPCPDCDGKRFRPDVCEVAWDGLGIADVLRLTVEDALARFHAHPRVLAALRPLADVGLGYLRLGQPLSTLSGGEAQRLRIAEALAEGKPGKPALYVLDEPTTGLHLEDVAVLLKAIDRLIARGHGVLAVEHHLDVMAAADLVVDLGPEGGPAGGRVVATGTPEEVAKGEGHTARHLRAHLEGRDDPDLLAQPGLGVGGADRVAEGAPGPRPARHLRGGRARAQPEGRLGPHPARRARRRHGAVGVGQVDARVRHRLRRGPAPLRRDPVGLRAPVHRPAPASRRRSRHGHPAHRRDLAARTTRGSSRSTVATQTEIAHFLRLLFAKTGVPHCPVCDRALEARAPEEILDRVAEDFRGKRVAILGAGRRGPQGRPSRGLRGGGQARAGARGRPRPPDHPDAEDRPVQRARRRRGRGPPDRRAGEARGAGPRRRGGPGAGSRSARRRGGRHRPRPVDEPHVPEGRDDGARTRPAPLQPQQPPRLVPRLQGARHRAPRRPDLLIADDEKSLVRGAIGALACDHDLLVKFVRDAVKTLGVDPRAAWGTLDAPMRRRLLAGGKRRRLPRRGVLLRGFRRACHFAIDWLGATRAAPPAAPAAGPACAPSAVRVGGSPRSSPSPSTASWPRSPRALVGRDVASPTRLRQLPHRLFARGARPPASTARPRSRRRGAAHPARGAARSNLRGACYVLDEPTIGLHVRDNARLLDALCDLTAGTR